MFEISNTDDNTQPLGTVTEDEIRIAIAESLGWTSITRKNRLEYGGLVGVDPKDGNTKIVPSFCRDLNAMHGAWLKLNTSQRDRFEAELYAVVIGDAGYNRNDDAPYITNATARQRAEAYLRTLNLWNAGGEGPPP